MALWTGIQKAFCLGSEKVTETVPMSSEKRSEVEEQRWAYLMAEKYHKLVSMVADQTIHL